ncbi:MAG: acetate--CoA ligase [Acidobacteria bacterium]|nr:acetate--CoA ligase [Acidobacteriota bacterium]
MSEASRIYPVQDRIRSQSYLKSRADYQAMYQKSVSNPDEFWREQAMRISWFHPFDRVSDWDLAQASVRWFEGGKLNVSYNCIDRHLESRGDQTAIIFEADEPEHARHISYRELHAEVCRVANVLKSFGVKKGDRVCIYLPMIPELAYTMLACARIGAIHSIVFAGFSADAIRDRIIDSQASMVVTANEGLRGGKRIALKTVVDKAVDGLDVVKTVLVAKHTETEVNMVTGRDFDMAEEKARQRPTCPPEWMDAEDPLFILYTSGSTGKPKGLMHTTGGYLVYASLTHQYVFDVHPGDIYCCAADIGWVTGHTYIIYGPLTNGTTTIMFESVPTYPHAGRYWDMVQRHKVNIFYTAPTAIRAIAREGNQWVAPYDLSSLRILGTVGEPINPEAWEWYYQVVGKSQCTIVDTWWQTETGGILITPLPGVNDLKPGAATLPFFGVQPCVVDQDGQEITTTEAKGYLCMKAAWPGMARTVYGDHERFKQTYFSQYPGLYFTGDGCTRDRDGDYWITGRVDDVINVSGHRLGTAEIESSINAHEWIAESAVIGYPHEIKGTGILAFVILNADAGSPSDADVSNAVRGQVSSDIGKIARPDMVLVCPGLPKTRSGKIMRRILRKISIGAYDDLGNVTTLADPSVVDQIIQVHKNHK